MNTGALTILVLIFTTLFTYGQPSNDEPLKKLVSSLQQYQLGRPYEKVHLHMDKPFYAIGDKIWFKAYVVQAERNYPSNLSKILYVEFINEKDSIQRTLKLPLFFGLAWGEFALTDSLEEGNYRIRAYTNWMRNFGEDYFFDKTITIGNAITNNIITGVTYSYTKEGSSQKVAADINYNDINGNAIAGKDVTYEVQLDAKTISKGKGKTNDKGNLNISFFNDQPADRKSGIINTIVKLDDKREVPKSFPVKSTSNDIAIQFFPEGGDLVSGLASMVAFKATGGDGRGVPVRGYLTDQADNRLSEFKSEHAGSGIFALRPQSGMKYKAVVKFEDGTEKSFDLPAVRQGGYVLSIDNADPDNLRLSISSSQELIDQEVVLIAQSNNKIHFVSKSKLIGSRLTSNIPKNRFPQGILHVTLFTIQNEPIAERLVFIDHQEQLKIEINTIMPSFSKREKVKLSLNVTDKDNKPVLGNFSVTVIDETKVPYDEIKETTILSNLLLTSDLKGYIQSPNYYFTNADSVKARHLDLLMLTQGWRRFAWTDILSGTHTGLTYQPEQGLSVNGKVTLSGKPVVNGKVTLFYMDGRPVLLDTVTDTQGRFAFNKLYFPDSTRVVLQARTARDRKDVDIHLDQSPPPLMTKNRNYADTEVNVNKMLVPYLRNSRNQFDSLRRMSSGSIMLKEVSIVEKKQLDVRNSSNLNGPGNADQLIAGKKLEAFCLFDLSQCLQGLVTGLIMKDGIPYLNRHITSSLSQPTQMLILVDGMEVDSSYLSYISPGDVEFIEVLKTVGSTAIYGSRAVCGALLITMKKGGYTSEKDSYTPGVARISPQGLYKTREFYSPSYNDGEINPAIPDLRTTIYWNPDVTTKSNGTANIEFCNADGTGKYKVIVEGINEAGNIGRSVYSYLVK